MNRQKFPNPMSPPEGVKKYEKKRYAKSDQKLINRREHKIMHTLLSKTGLECGHILNVPCGFGRFTNILKRFNHTLCYMDLHPKMVSRCQEKHKEGNLFTHGSIRNLPFEDASFDMVMTIRFFHHYFETEDRIRILKELARVTKKYVILTYYQTNIVHWISKKLKRKKNRIIMLRPKTFRKELADAGLRITSKKNPLPLLHAQQFILAEKECLN